MIGALRVVVFLAAIALAARVVWWHRTKGTVPMADETLHAGDPFAVDVAAGTNNDSVTLYQDGVEVGPRTVENGIASFPYPDGLAKGTYAFTATGLNAEGESAPTPPTVLALAGQLPGVPSGISIRFTVAP
jgi:hypothetical protein